MTYRTIADIPFRVRSPSHYEISGREDMSSFIDLCVVSFERDKRWYISVLMKQGHTIQRGPFASLAEACGVIAGQTRGVA